MIQSKQEYKYYLKMDLTQSDIINKKWYEKKIDRRYKFYKSLRYTEYCYNCNTLKNKIIRKFVMLRHRRLCDKYCWTIPINVFGPGLTIVHVGTIVVSGSAKVGKNCRIHVCTNIGRAPSHGKSGAPIIGDNVYIGPRS